LEPDLDLDLGLEPDLDLDLGLEPDLDLDLGLDPVLDPVFITLFSFLFGVGVLVLLVYSYTPLCIDIIEFKNVFFSIKSFTCLNFLFVLSYSKIIL
jgi:hypothetical protein